MNYVKKEDILKSVANPYAFAGSDAFPYKDESGQIWPWDSSNDVWGDPARCRYPCAYSAYGP